MGYKITLRWFNLLACLALLLGSYSLFIWPARAEGSRTLYPAGIAGNRANIEWRNSFYGNFLRRRTLFQLYAEEDEVILLGSSAVGVDQGDILIYHPGQVTGPVGNEIIPGAPDFSCIDQRSQTQNPNQGRINSREQELAGPDTITDTATAAPGNDVANGYVPCFYVAPETGIYHVIFHGPAGADSDREIEPTGQVDLVSPDNFNAQQGTSIAAWDVTVRQDLASTDDINGRLFADYLTAFTRTNPSPLYSDVFFLTRDGYLWRTNFKGLDPFGFIIYANDVGFLDSDGSPLFQDVVAVRSIPPEDQNQLNQLQGDTRLAPPTHLAFLNPPAEEAILANNFPTAPIYPFLEGFQFEGRLGNQDTYVGGGGVFTFTSTLAGMYWLIISRDGANFDPVDPGNRVFRDLTVDIGTHTINWDGLDNSGNPFPIGSYTAKFIIRAGEHHFPMLDVENSQEGGPSYELVNPPEGRCPSFDGGPPSCVSGFYDDRGYRAANGVEVGTPGEVLPGSNPPDLPFADLQTGYDSRTDQRAFGDGTEFGFGDKKGLDIWTYYPSDPAFTQINVLGLNLVITKSDGDITAERGGVIPYTLNYANTGVALATGVVITEEVPLYTTFNQAASAPTVWSCPDGSPAGTICTTQVATVTGGSSGSVNFAVTVLESVPPEVTQIENAVLIGDDGTHGPEPTDDNNSGDITPLVPPTPTDEPIAGGDDDDDDDDDDAAAPPPPPLAQAPPTPIPPTATPELQPTLPVILLPETGNLANQARPVSNPITSCLALLSAGVILLGLLILKKPT
jgi:uncharacterized repeat protein (TIGR01451 family)